MKVTKLSAKRQGARDVIINDLWEYAQYVNPNYAYGDTHKEIYQKLDGVLKAGSRNYGYLIPRDHLKSHMLATTATWIIARDPACSILYMVADEDLGVLQLDSIKATCLSARFTNLFPDHFRVEEGKRTKWAATAITCDHPLRKSKQSRDETVRVKTYRSGKTGRHPSHILFDDIVVPENAYSAKGRQDVATGAHEAVTMLKNTGVMLAAGTVYDSRDQYHIWQEERYESYNEAGDYCGSKPSWEFTILEMEDEGNGDGNYIWPRVYQPELKEWFGWSARERAKKYAAFKSSGETHKFWAQYYMRANAPDSCCIDSDMIQKYDARELHYEHGQWTYHGKPLMISFGMDTASTDKSSSRASGADYSAMAIVAVDSSGMKLVIDLWQEQTTDMEEVWKTMVGFWEKWNFNIAHIEKIAGVSYLIDYLRKRIKDTAAGFVIVADKVPTKFSKEERHEAITYPSYRSGLVHHRNDGLFLELEQQLALERPQNDDLLDAVTIAFSKLKKPLPLDMQNHYDSSRGIVVSNRTYGGRR